MTGAGDGVGLGTCTDAAVLGVARPGVGGFGVGGLESGNGSLGFSVGGGSDGIDGCRLDNRSSFLLTRSASWRRITSLNSSM